MELIIIGASGHGKVVADIAERCGYDRIVFLDDDKDKKTCLGYPVVGGIEDARQYAEADFVVAIGNPEIREKVQCFLAQNGLHIATLIHPEAVVATAVSIGEGTVVMAGAVINPDTVIGEGCIVNTGATVDHDNVLADYVHVSVGSHLAGMVSVGRYTWIGAGATISNNVLVCDSCVVGAGAVVIKDITESGTYIGIPAKKMKEQDYMNISETKNRVGGGINLEVVFFLVSDRVQHEMRVSTFARRAA